jgi:hypothetical protein
MFIFLAAIAAVSATGILATTISPAFAVDSGNGNSDIRPPQNVPGYQTAETAQTDPHSLGQP